MNSFAGLRIIESLYLTEPGDPIIVRRTWRERLFSRPWRPFVTTRVVVPQIPYRGAVPLNEHTVVMHPAIVGELRRQAGEGGR